MKKTLLLLMFASTIMVSQTLKRPVNSCYNLKQKNENYASGDNYKSYCNIKKQTAFTSCMCEYETKLKNYKEELENNQNKFRSLDNKFANLMSKASNKSSRGTYLVTGINDSKNFSEDKLKVSELLNDAEYLLNDASELAYELDDICLKIYNNCERNKRIKRVKELEKDVENAKNTLLNAAPSKTIRIKPGSSSGESSVSNSKKKNKNDDESDDSELSDYEKQKIEYTYKANSLYKSYQNTNNYKKKKQILRELKVYQEFLPSYQKSQLKRDLKEERTREVVSSVSRPLINVDYGEGRRRLLLTLATGADIISGKDDDQGAFGIPLRIGIDFTIPISKTLAIDVFGAYNTNLFIDLSFLTGGIEPTEFDVVDVNSLPDPEEDIIFDRYFYGIGLNIGKNRKFTASLLSHSMKYSHKISYGDKVDYEIDFGKSIPTYGLGLMYDFNGKYKQDLSRLSVSYTLNDKNLSFLDSSFKDNKYSNLNARWEAAIGAMMIGFEYNLFKDDVLNRKVSAFTISLGLYFGKY